MLSKTLLAFSHHIPQVRSFRKKKCNQSYVVSIPHATSRGRCQYVAMSRGWDKVATSMLWHVFVAEKIKEFGFFIFRVSKIFQRKAMNSHIVYWPYLSISYQCIWQLWELLCKWGYPEVIANILRIFHDQGFGTLSVNGIAPNLFFFINQISALQQTLDNYPFWKCNPAWQPKQCTSIRGPISSPPIGSPFPAGCHLPVIPLRKVNLGWWRNILCTQRKSCTITYLYGLRKATQVEN